MSQKRVINQKHIDQICQLIRCGNYVSTSVRAVGCNYETFKGYMRKGKDGKKPYVDYYDQVEAAKASFETQAINKIVESGEAGNVGAYMWMLPRMYPNRWAKTQRQEIQVDNKQKIELVKLSDVKEEDKE